MFSIVHNENALKMNILFISMLVNIFLVVFFLPITGHYWTDDLFKSMSPCKSEMIFNVYFSKMKDYIYLEIFDE